MAFYLTGDCHGQFDKLIIFVRNHRLTSDDVIIILGDVAFNYYGNERDEENKKIFTQFPNTIFCVHGNHEERPFNLPNYKVKKWNGAMVYYETEYPNLLFAKDGEVYKFGEKKAIVIGGAYSVDKDYRLRVGMPWFRDEQPSAEIKAYVEEQLEKNDWKVDYVLSHTCPLKFEPTDLYLGFIDQTSVDKSTEQWLSTIEEKLSYKKWYFGHFHENREYIDAEMLFEEIKELGKNGFVQRIGRPKYKKGEMVLFYLQDNEAKYECYGRIVCVDAYGTMEQTKEVSYDIEGPDYRDSRNKMLYKHVVESELQSLNDLMEKSRKGTNDRKN